MQPANKNPADISSRMPTGFTCFGLFNNRRNAVWANSFRSLAGFFRWFEQFRSYLNAANGLGSLKLAREVCVETAELEVRRRCG